MHTHIYLLLLYIYIFIFILKSEGGEKNLTLLLSYGLM